jgi:hypothetical protein
MIPFQMASTSVASEGISTSCVPSKACGKEGHDWQRRPQGIVSLLIPCPCYKKLVGLLICT